MLRLRPALDQDQAFLRQVYAGTRADEIALTGWDDATAEAFLRMQFDAQQAHYRTHRPGASVDVIEAGAVAVGRLYVAREPGLIHVVDIALLPAFRGRGYGSELLGALLAEARAGAARVTIYVEQGNRALSLYQRLGFKPVSQISMSWLMEWQCAATAPQPS